MSPMKETDPGELERLASERPQSMYAWMQVAIKPAKPLAFAAIGGVPVFGLPGNPVSSRVSFELLARRMLGNVPRFFDVESFRVMVERRHNAVGDLVTVSEATVKVRIDGETVLSVGEGNGPVNALDNALRKDLGPYQSFIDDLELVDYKVRILTGGTDAVTRVLIESRDGEGNRWFTVGVSPNIVDASFEALIDSINYKLIRDGAPAP